MTTIATEPSIGARVALYDDQRLLEAKDVAELLCVPVSWVREHTRTGRLPHVELGRYVRYRRSAILDYIQAQETGGAAWRKHRPRAGTAR